MRSAARSGCRHRRSGMRAPTACRNCAGSWKPRSAPAPSVAPSDRPARSATPTGETTMPVNRPRLVRAVLAAATLGALATLTGQAAGQGGRFVEPVRVLQTFHGDSPGAQFGWAVSELGDIDGDGAKEAIVGEPFRGPAGATGRVDVYSART